MTIGEKIKSLRISAGLTQEELATAAGTTKQTIHKYETGIISNIPASKIKAMADKLKTTPAYIMGWSAAPSPVTETNEVGTPYNPVVHKIPILGCISAGLPLYADEHIESYTYTERNGGADYFALRVKGDSMSAVQINDKNLVIVRKQDSVDNGEIAVVRVNKSEATIKKFRQDGKTVQLIPQSFNPVHEVQFYDLDKDDIEIIGKVVECKVEF